MRHHTASSPRTYFDYRAGTMLLVIALLAMLPWQGAQAAAIMGEERLSSPGEWRMLTQAASVPGKAAAMNNRYYSELSNTNANQQGVPDTNPLAKNQPSPVYAPPSATTSLKFVKTWTGVPKGSAPEISVSVCYQRGEETITVPGTARKLRYPNTILEWQNLPYAQGINYQVCETNLGGFTPGTPVYTPSVVSSVKYEPSQHQTSWTLQKPNFIITRTTHNGPYVIWTLNQVENQQEFITNVLAAAGSSLHQPLQGLAEHAGQIIWLSGSRVNYDVFPADPHRGQITIRNTFTMQGTVDKANITYQGENTWTHFATGEYSSQVVALENTYDAKGTLTLHGIKTLQGRGIGKEDDFTFSVRDGKNLVATGANNGTGGITFTPIQYTLADVARSPITLTVDENQSEMPAGVTPDRNSYIVTVLLSDKADGTLAVVPFYSGGGLEFVNTYEAAGSLTLTGTKILEGRGMREGDNFTFIVKEGETQVATGANSGTGTITFTPIQYTLADVARSPIILTVAEEQKAMPAGVSPDNSKHTVTVALDDNGDGTLTAIPSYPEKGLVFLNSYEPPAPAVVHITAEKELHGQQLRADQFLFDLQDREGNVLQTVGNDAEGKVVFQPVVFSAPGEDLILQVAERKGKAPGITYDETRYTLHYHVMLQQGNVLGAELVMVEKNGVEAGLNDALTFRNLYTPPTPSYPALRVPIKFQKILRNAPLQAGAFTFQLKDAQGKVLAQVTNDAQGGVTFPERTFSRAVSNYLYTISEVPGNDPQMTYDDTVYTLKVTTWGEEGKLKYKVDAKKDGVPYGGDLTFVNQSIIPPTGDRAPRTMALLLAGGTLLGGWTCLDKRKKQTKTK